jgi:hypothetical protein
LGTCTVSMNDHSQYSRLVQINQETHGEDEQIQLIVPAALWIADWLPGKSHLPSRHVVAPQHLSHPTRAATPLRSPSSTLQYSPVLSCHLLSFANRCCACYPLLFRVVPSRAVNNDETREQQRQAAGEAVFQWQEQRACHIFLQAVSCYPGTLCTPDTD